MKAFLISLALVVSIIVISAFGSDGPQPANKWVQDSLTAERQRYFDEILNSLKGRENTQADSVFRNLKTFTGPASVKVTHFLGIMRYWGASLGVSCTHCHNTADWSSDEKQAKLIARDMFAMRQTINGQILKNIKGLQSETPRVNCRTCHGGKLLPKE
ncbi:MAG: c-type cytochrome [Chitinophagaceae bacterium]